MLQFNNSTTSKIFKTTMKTLEGDKQASFAKEVKNIADKKIISDSDDFTVNIQDLQAAATVAGI